MYPRLQESMGIDPCSSSSRTAPLESPSNSPGHTGRQSDGRGCSPYVRGRACTDMVSLGWNVLWQSLSASRETLQIFLHANTASHCPPHHPALTLPALTLPSSDMCQISLTDNPGPGISCTEEERRWASQSTGRKHWPSSGNAHTRVPKPNAVQNSVTIFSVSSLQKDFWGSVGCGNIIQWQQQSKAASKFYCTCRNSNFQSLIIQQNWAGFLQGWQKPPLWLQEYFLAKPQSPVPKP